jgi:DNA replication protein DnaC
MYEYVNGESVRSEWAGRKIPVPPQVLREKLRLPKKYQNSCLHTDVASEYNEVYRERAVEYVKAFSKEGARGRGIVFAGPPRLGSSSAAAALMNEIMMRNLGKADMTASWLSCFYILRMIMDAKSLNRYDMYTSMRNAAFQDDVLVVDNLLAASNVDGGLNFMRTVYSYREDHCLPTITTVTTPEAGMEIGPLIEKVFGKEFTERLKYNTIGFVSKV